jgi:CubicO group peptidase (beta-lactamase class C family)
VKRLLLILLLIIPPPAAAQSTAPLEKIRTTVEAAIARGELPGAVVLVNRNSKTLYFQAIGQRAIAPKPEAMTPDTIFDLASLTKPIATAACIWKLVEEGKLKVTDRVSQYWPEFTGAGKEKITLEQLLLHTSGLMADNALSDYQSGKELAFKKICKLPLEAEPGVRFMSAISCSGIS